MTRYKKGLRQQVYDKFGGKCAYTGKALGEDWQIDHITSKNMSKYMNCYINNPNFDVNDFTNLFPALRIVNHYKRELDLEGFRIYMLSFHKRLSKLPKNTIVKRTMDRKIYMYAIADAFDITPEKPFSGVFYFETLK